MQDGAECGNTFPMRPQQTGPDLQWNIPFNPKKPPLSPLDTDLFNPSVQTQAFDKAKYTESLPTKHHPTTIENTLRVFRHSGRLRDKGRSLGSRE